MVTTRIATPSARHGYSKRPIYYVWAAMMARCFRESTPGYHNYGGRGITVCERWRKFSNFLADMGEANGLTLDRIDNNGSYSPDNCRWATQKQQMHNTRSNVRLTFNDETLCMAEWAERIGMRVGTLAERINRGMGVEAALLTPSRKCGLTPKSQRKKQGLCVSCGRKKAVKIQSGKVGTRCQSCKDRHNAHLAKHRASRRPERPTTYRYLTFQNETLCISEWARRIGMSVWTLHARIARGVSVEVALTMPSKGRGGGRAWHKSHLA